MKVLNDLLPTTLRSSKSLLRAIRLSVLALSVTAAAHATTLDFTLTPTNGVGGTYSFSAPQNPVTGAMPGDGFFYVSPTGTGGFFAGPDTVFFITTGSIYAGTIQLINSDFSTQVYLDGPQLFTGTEDSPTFLLGTFLLTNLTVPSAYPVPDGDQVGQSYNLVVTEEGTTAVTPEPSSLILLGTGLLGSVGILRRKFATV
jgi:hypothetical protein